MGNKKNESGIKARKQPSVEAGQLSVAAKAVDPTLAALFDSTVCIPEDYSLPYIHNLRLVLTLHSWQSNPRRSHAEPPRHVSEKSQASFTLRPVFQVQMQSQ